MKKKKPKETMLLLLGPFHTSFRSHRPPPPPAFHHHHHQQQQQQQQYQPPPPPPLLLKVKFACSNNNVSLVAGWCLLHSLTQSNQAAFFSATKFEKQHVSWVFFLGWVEVGEEGGQTHTKFSIFISIRFRKKKVEY